MEPLSAVEDLMISWMKDQKGNFTCWSFRFGYIHYETVAEAQKALENMNGFTLGSRQIRVDFAAQREDQVKSTA